TRLAALRARHLRPRLAIAPPSGCGRNSSERGTCPRSHAGDPEEGKEGWGRRENLAVQSEGRFTKRLASKENEGDAWQRRLEKFCEYGERMIPRGRGNHGSRKSAKREPSCFRA
ncbi:hypothetical protein Celaphus_00013788, partial [Cervus elaphus hippelaphus]